MLELRLSFLLGPLLLHLLDLARVEGKRRLTHRELDPGIALLDRLRARTHHQEEPPWRWLVVRVGKRSLADRRSMVGPWFQVYSALRSTCDRLAEGSQGTSLIGILLRSDPRASMQSIAAGLYAPTRAAAPPLLAEEDQRRQYDQCADDQAHHADREQ
jgi:hypothetical protein